MGDLTAAGFRVDTRTVACACGSIVTADPKDPFPGVRAHVLTLGHRAWSERTSLTYREPSEGSTASPVALVDVSGHRKVRPAFRRLAAVR